jgi:hypothetical protein
MKEKELTDSRVLADFWNAYDFKRPLLEHMDEDFRFALGEQWEPEDVDKLEKIGVRAFTINKVRPIVQLLRGIEAQNRSDLKVFREGAEDALKAEIATSALKNVMKNADGDYKVGELWEDGITGGESYLEPYLDYTDNILFAKLRFKKVDYWQVFPDPESREYDLSDAKYICKLSYDLTKDQLKELFPKKEKEIDGLGEAGKFQHPGQDAGLFLSVQRRGYKDANSTTTPYGDIEQLYDLLEYYYKKYVPAYYVADKKIGELKKAASKQEAESYVDAANAATPDSAEVITRRLPEIWVRCYVGNSETPLDDYQAWCWPGWKSWPFIPYYAYKTTVRIRQESRHLLIQGTTRNVKDLNRELNKRRTQELRHLNQSANSGWLTPENSWTDRDKVEQFGSTPGINLEYKQDVGKPERIFPMPLSQGHTQLAQENAQDIKDASGINADLLAVEEGGQSSGRAIALRQKQGLVMVQGLFDNLSRTKRLLGRFILSQLRQCYSVDMLIRVLGDAFLKDNFMVPVVQQVVNPQTGQPIQMPVVDPMTGQPAMQLDQKAVVETFNAVLNDTEIGNYDVAIGENLSSDTLQYANYLTLTDMASKGVPVPPEVLLDESQVSEGSKEKIKQAIQQQQQMMLAGQPKKGEK